MCTFILYIWILNSLGPDLFVGAIYAKTAYKIWSDLKETCDKVDGSAVFNLHKSIKAWNQNGASLAEYYNNLNSLWKQFDAMISLPLVLVRLLNTLKNIINLLIVSSEESHKNATTIGATKPTATVFVAKTFDNKRWFNNNNNRGSGSNSNSNSNNRDPNPNLKCTNCNKISHTVDRCFKLIGYPTGYVKRDFIANARLVSRSNAYANVQYNNVSSNNATTSISPVSLYNE
ncbi:hypothetical protein Tco_0386618 [Tanacetum coccineum]